MKKNVWILSALLALPLLFGSAYAHDGGGYGADGGWGGAAHHGECQGHHLPEAKMKILHDAMKTSFEKDKALHEKAHKLHEQLKDVLAADTFDRKAFLNLRARLADIHARIGRDRAEAFASVAGQFTPEERKEIAEMHHGHHHGFEHDEFRHHHDGDQEDQSSLKDDQSGPQGKDYPPYSPR